MTKLSVNSILAGMLISIGGLGFLFSENKLTGSLLFTIGLFTILELGYNLYTGKLCYIYPIDKTNNFIIGLLKLAIIFIGNYIGSFIISKLILMTVFPYNTNIIEKVNKITSIKMGYDYSTLLILGILCGFCIYFAVEVYKTSMSPISRVFAVIISVIVFINCGFEHSIADMFYFNMTYNCNILQSDVLVRLLVIGLGNFIGGYFFSLIHYLTNKSMRN